MQGTLSADAGSCLLVNSLLSDEITRQVEGEKIDDEHVVLTLVELVAKVGIEAANAFQKRYFLKFDSNPGEDGCQSRAAIMLHLSDVDLSEECQRIDGVCRQIKKLVEKRRGQVKPYGDRSPTMAIFRRAIGEIRGSKEMEFLLLGRLLTILRTKFLETDEGIAVTKTEMSKLSMLTKYAGRIDGDIRRLIVSRSQVRHTEQCNELMYELAQREICKRMSHPDNVMLYTADPAYSPKHFGCHYFEVVTLLDLVEAKKALLAFRIHEKRGQAPFYLYYCEGKRVGPPDPDAAVIYIQCAARGRRGEIIAELEGLDLREAILSQAARSTPYHQKSTLADVKDAEAARMIRRSRDANLLHTLAIDHIYLQQPQFEVKEIAKLAPRPDTPPLVDLSEAAAISREC